MADLGAGTAWTTRVVARVFLFLAVVSLAAGCEAGPGSTTTAPTVPVATSDSGAPFTPPPTESTQLSSPSSRTTGAGSSTGSVIVVGGPTLGTNYPGAWGNWGAARFEVTTGPVPVGADGSSFTGRFFAPSSRAVGVLAVRVEPDGGPFRLISTSCVDAEITGPSPAEGVDPPRGVTGCDVVVGFRPRRRAPAQPGSPDQGYFRGGVAFTLTRRCSSRVDDPCSRIPSSVPVTAEHPVRVRWTRTVALYGATSCAPGQDACSGPEWSPTASPEPGTSPSSLSSAPPTSSSGASASGPPSTGATS